MCKIAVESICLTISLKDVTIRIDFSLSDFQLRVEQNYGFQPSNSWKMSTAPLTGQRSSSDIRILTIVFASLLHLDAANTMCTLGVEVLHNLFEQIWADFEQIWADFGQIFDVATASQKSVCMTSKFKFAIRRFLC